MLISVLGDILLCGDKSDGADKSDDLPSIPNPCFNGIWSASTILTAKKGTAFEVLILVLMGYGLRVSVGSY